MRRQKLTTSWFSDTRRLALLTCVAMVAGLPIPMWTATRAMLAIQSAHSLFGWTALALAYVFSLILPVFYLVFSRNEGPSRLTKGLRLVSLAGAVAGGIVVAAGTPQFAGSTGTSLATVKMVLSDFVNLSCILLLITFFRQPADGAPTDVPISKQLRFTSGAAVFGGVLWLFFNLIGLGVTAFQVQNDGNQPNARADMITGAIRTVLEQICLFTAPYIIYRSALRRVDVPPRND